MPKPATITKATTPPATMLHQQIGRHSQDVTLIELWQLGAHRLRVEIRSNAYRDQSHAIVERFDGDRWQPLYALLTHNMATPISLYSKCGHPEFNEPTPSPMHLVPAFTTDRGALLDAAAIILKES